jgi:predicted N-acetyltransferase YhbS
MPELRVYPDDVFPAELHWQAVSLMRVEWPFIEGGNLRRTYPSNLSPTHIVMEDDGLLLSYAAVIHLRLEHAGDVFRARGLGSVLTFPSSRRQGLGSQVVAAATALIRNSDADVAALFTGDDLERFYARHGWEAQPGAETFVTSHSTLEPIPALRLMLFLSRKGRAARQAFATQPLMVEYGW